MDTDSLSEGMVIMSITIQLRTGREIITTVSGEEVQQKIGGELVFQEFLNAQASAQQMQYLLKFAQQLVSILEKYYASERRSTMIQRYYENQTTLIGQTIHCPGCGITLKKTNKRQQFCSRIGKKNCKNQFWNIVKTLQIR